MSNKRYNVRSMLIALFSVASLPVISACAEGLRIDPPINSPAGQTVSNPPEKPATEAAAASAKTPKLTEQQIIDARQKFELEVLSVDTSKPYGKEFPYSDLVKLKITNNSEVTLPYLTVFTKRYSGGRVIGWSRVPPIDVHDLKPKQSKLIDYYPRGHLTVVPVDRLTVEIEPIDEENRRFIKELE